jgi:undecaprenyl diphosphate synthase
MPQIMIEPIISLPRHVVIIPDGNRRWAHEHGLTSLQGHAKGLERIQELSNVAQEMGIETVTIWGFSTENWERGSSEREYLFKLFMRMLRRVAREARQRNIRVQHLGRRDRLPSILINYLKKLEKDTVGNQYRLNIALDYGGRDEILRAVKHMMDDGITSGQLDEKLFSQYLDTGTGLSDPDLIIRTSGEQRMSGLLPWQGAYAEYYFSPLHLPDFGEVQFREAIAEYSRRQRRFGK